MSHSEHLWSMLINLHGCSVPQINPKIEEIGKLYKEINTFLIEVQRFNSDEYRDVDSFLVGHYMQAFCDGINSILDEYTKDMVELEQKLLNDSGLTSMSIIVSTNGMKQILELLVECVHKIKMNKVKGCQLFDICHLYTHCGVPFVEETFTRIEGCCLNVLFMQILKWITHSELFDPSDEFIIKFDDNKTIGKIKKYKINCELLPECLSLECASRILFIGEHVAILQQENHFPSVTPLEKDNFEFNILKIFHDLCNNQPFCFGKFSDKIKEIWTSVNKDIRKLAENGNVREQLSLMKDIYLLGRGELFHEFLTKSMNYLSYPASMRMQRTLNKTLEEAMRSVYLIDDKALMGNIEIVLPKQHGDIKEIVIDVISVKTKIKKPLVSLFSSEIMENYNKVFIFLLKLKKAQIDITAIWPFVNQINDEKLMMLAIDIRNQLLALIGNLQNYCLTQVIGDENNLLISKLDSSDTYTQLQEALINFQNNILINLFIPNEKITKYFLEIFEQCEIFSKLSKKSSPYTYDSLQIFKTKFVKLIKDMFIFFENYESYSDSTQIHNLLLYLDCNNYFRNRYLKQK